MEAIKRQLECDSHDELWRDQDIAEDTETVVIDVGTAEVEINDAEDNIGDTE